MPEVHRHISIKLEVAEMGKQSTFPQQEEICQTDCTTQKAERWWPVNPETWQLKGMLPGSSQGTDNEELLNV